MEKSWQMIVTVFLPILWFPKLLIFKNWNAFCTISNMIIIVVNFFKVTIKSLYDVEKKVMDFEFFIIEKSWKSHGIYISRRCRNPDFILNGNMLGGNQYNLGRVGGIKPVNTCILPFKSSVVTHFQLVIIIFNLIFLFQLIFWEKSTSRNFKRHLLYR